MISAVCLFLAYVVTAVAGLHATGLNTFAALAWPPTGIAFVGLLFYGRGRWPAIFAGALVANLYMGAPILVALAIATGNTLEALLAVYLCTYGGNFQPTLARFSDVTKLIVGASAISTLFSASIGVFALWSAGTIATDQFGPTWVQWWAGDVLSDLTFAPLLLVLVAGGWTAIRPANWQRALEAVFMFAVVGSITFSILSGTFLAEYFSSPGRRGLYLIIPLVLWAAVRFGQRGAILAQVLVSMAAIFETAQGVGPFAASGLPSNVIHLLVFVLVVSITGLMVGAVVTERENERRAAEGASLAKSEFLANMSHEIRTPLGAVMGFSELLLEPGLTDADRERYAETIRRNGQMLLGIIDDVLDLSRVELGKIQVERTPLKFGDLMADVKTSMQPRAAAKSIELKVSVDPKIPAEIVSDPQRLRQILLNLIGNAIKFTSQGAVEVSAQLESPTELVVAVKDSGIGIDPKNMDKIFNPFTQADASTTRKFGGSGLGLSLSRKIAHALGGDIFLSESRLGEGSTFKLRLALNG